MSGSARKSLLVVLVALALCGLASGQSPDQSSPPSPPETPAQQDVPRRVRISAGVTQGLLIKKVNPKYPKQARKKHIQGTVLLYAKISKDGDIADLTLISGDPLLAKAAIDAVKQWKYRPYLLLGEPVEVETQIQVNFMLSR